MAEKRSSRQVASGQEHSVCHMDISPNPYAFIFFGRKKTGFKLKLKKLFFIFKCFWFSEHKQCCLATWLMENNITLISLPEKSIARHTRGSEDTKKR